MNNTSPNIYLQLLQTGYKLTTSILMAVVSIVVRICLAIVRSSPFILIRTIYFFLARSIFLSFFFKVKLIIVGIILAFAWIFVQEVNHVLQALPSPEEIGKVNYALASHIRFVLGKGDIEREWYL